MNELNEELKQVYADAFDDFITAVKYWSSVTDMNDSTEYFKGWKKEFNRLFDRIISIRELIEE